MHSFSHDYTFHSFCFVFSECNANQYRTTLCNYLQFPCTCKPFHRCVEGNGVCTVTRQKRNKINTLESWPEVNDVLYWTQCCMWVNEPTIPILVIPVAVLVWIVVLGIILRRLFTTAIYRAKKKKNKQCFCLYIGRQYTMGYQITWRYLMKSIVPCHQKHYRSHQTYNLRHSSINRMVAW